MTFEQIFTIFVLSLWLLFPLGVLVSFIKLDNESSPPKIVVPETASEKQVDSVLYASEDFDDEDDLDELIEDEHSLYEPVQKTKITNDINTQA